MFAFIIFFLRRQKRFESRSSILPEDEESASLGKL